MERKAIYIPSSSGKVSLKAIPGHFATNHSHVNYYIDMTDIKSNQSVAEEIAKMLAQQYTSSNPDSRNLVSGRHRGHRWIFGAAAFQNQLSRREPWRSDLCADARV